MQIPLNDYVWEKIDQKDLFIADLVCCDVVVSSSDRICSECEKKVDVSMIGRPNPIQQNYRWQLFIGKPQEESLSDPMCARCDIRIDMEDLSCKRCGNFYDVVLKRKSRNSMATTWEVHRSIVMKRKYACKDVHVVVKEDDTPVVQTPLRYNFLKEDLLLGELYCPVGSHGWGNPGIAIEASNGTYRCTSHDTMLEAVLVRREGKVYVERRCHYRDGSGSVLYEDADRVIAPLCCPNCQGHISHPGLRCLTCQEIIIDVGLDLWDQRDDIGHLIHRKVQVVIKPRSVFNPARPSQGLLKMEGFRWQQNRMPILHDPEPQTTEPPEPKTPQRDNVALREKIMQLKNRKDKNGKKLYTLEKIGKKLGISKSLVQHYINQKPSKIRRPKSEKSE